MSSLSLLLLLLVSLSVNACTGARHLRDAHPKLGAKSAEVKKAKLLKPLLSADQKLHEVDEGEVASVKTGENGGTLVGATVDDQKNAKDAESVSGSKAQAMTKEEKNTISGHEYEKSSSGVGLQEATKLEGTGRQLGSVSDVGSVDVADEESRESLSRSDVVTGVFSRDYEQPQRKPPIHN